MSKFRTHDKASAEVVSIVENLDAFKVGGIWNFECIDKDGNLKWEENVHNLVTNEGIDHLLNVHFHGTTQVNPWYVGLKGSGTVLAADTLASQANWSEFTDYTGDRQAFIEGAAASQSIDNSGSPAAFPITGSGTVAGAMMASVATTTTGTLFSAVDFTASRSVSNGDTISR